MFQEEVLKQRKDEYESSLSELQKLQEDNEKAHEETEELFSAIQEIALNLEQKKTEVAEKAKENEDLSVALVQPSCARRFDYRTK